MNAEEKLKVLEVMQRKMAYYAKLIGEEADKEQAYGGDYLFPSGVALGYKLCAFGVRSLLNDEQLPLPFNREIEGIDRKE